MFISKSLSKVVSSKATRDMLSDVGSEFLEEYLQEIIDPVVRNITLNENNEFKPFTKEALIAGISGSLNAGISNYPKFKYNKNREKIYTKENVTNLINNQSQNNLENSIVNSAVNNTINENNIQPSIKEQFSQNNKIDNNIYTYEKTDNIKINNMKESASKYFNNTEQSQNFINTIEKVITDKNYSILFDNTISNKTGNQVNAQIKTLANGETEIRLNPNSPRSGEFLIMHEVTHAIETENMKKLILGYASKHNDFNEALESLKQTYGTNDVSSEVVADISGQLLGNQEFINNLSMEKPNIFKQIYNAIISFANKITGNSHEALFIKDLKAKWENAYRTQNNNVNESNFSIQQDSKGNKYVSVDTNQNIFDGIKPKDYSKIAKQYILENFRDKGIDFNQENINVTSKTAKEYAYPRTALPYYIKDSKMKASTELDNLLNVSTYQYSKADDGRHIFAKDGWDYYKTKFTVGNKAFEGLINIGKNGNKKTLYDITNLKEVSHIGTSDKSFSESVRPPLNDNTLSQNNDKVKLLIDYSMQKNNNNTWQQYLENNYTATGTKTNMQDIKIPTSKDIKQLKNKDINLPLKSDFNDKDKTKILNSLEISNLTKENANTTPNLLIVDRNEVGDGNSKFYNNTKNVLDLCYFYVYLS